MPSFEQMPDFVVLRRVLRAIDPQYVLQTKSSLAARQHEVDLDRKIISVSEVTPLPEAILHVLFLIGRVKETIGTTSNDLDTLATAFARRDRAAARWALETYNLFWPEAPAAQAILSTFTVSAFLWRKCLE